MSTIATLAAEARSALAGSFNGTLTGPGDAGYDEARSVYNAMIDRRPGLVARCTSAADVAAVIGFARSQNALIAVHGGGHNGGGLGVCDDGVVIGTRPGSTASTSMPPPARCGSAAAASGRTSTLPRTRPAAPFPAASSAPPASAD